MTLCLPGLPVILKYCLASFHAVSTASPPPLVKKTLVEVAGGVVGDALGELDGVGVGVGPERVERQFLGLLGGGLGDLLAAVADLGDEQSGQRVEVALALGVVDVGALTPDDDRDVGLLVGAHPGEMHPQVVAGRLLQGGVVQVEALVDRHAAQSAAAHRLVQVNPSFSMRVERLEPAH